MIENKLEQLIETAKSNKTPLSIYTDGACSGNPGPGGWGAVFIASDSDIQEDLFGGEPDTTNNRMEMMAAIEALAKVPPTCAVILFTDSEYLKNGITLWIKNWKKNAWKKRTGEAVKNQDLWMRLDALCAERTVEWKWVKGHSGHPLNERADALARRSIIAHKVRAS